MSADPISASSADTDHSSAIGIMAQVYAARSVRLCVSDPNGGEPIAGVVLHRISATHVAFRAEDGLIWSVAAVDLRPAWPTEVAP